MEREFGLQFLFVTLGKATPVSHFLQAGIQDHQKLQLKDKLEGTEKNLSHIGTFLHITFQKSGI